MKNFLSKMNKNKEKIIYLLVIIFSFLFFVTLKYNLNKTGSEWSDQFFDSDVFRVIENLRNSDLVPQSRSTAHPLYPLFAVSVAKISSLLGFKDLEFLFYKTIFGTMGFFLFWLYIYKTKNLFTAFSALVLLMSTMTVRVWTAIPETFLFGFFTLMLALNAARVKYNLIFIVVSSFSGTITNSFFGIFYSILKINNIKKYFYFASQTILIILGLVVVQKNIYPSATHFFDPGRMFRDIVHFNIPLNLIPYRFFDFFFSGFVLPLSVPGNNFPLDTYNIWKNFFIFQRSLRLNLAIYLSILIVFFLLFFSIFNFMKNNKKNILDSTIYAFIFFQLILHMTFGYSPFLYSYHFLPFLIIIATNQNFKNSITLPVIFILLSLCIQEVNIAHYGETFMYFFF
jgi:hypothetical protein